MKILEGAFKVFGCCVATRITVDNIFQSLELFIDESGQKMKSFLLKYTENSMYV